MHAPLNIEAVAASIDEEHASLARKTIEQVKALQHELEAGFARERSALEAAHAERTKGLEARIDDLEKQVEVAQRSLAVLVGEREKASWSAATRFLMGKRALTRKNVFGAWAKLSSDAKAERLLSHVAHRRYAQRLKARTLSAWYRFVHGSQTSQFAARADERLRAVTSEIVARYEAELDKLKLQIKGLEAQVLDAKRRRGLLEDELRRTLLKGMVSMNLETLSIFKAAAANDLSTDDSAEPLPRTTTPPEPELMKLLHEAASDIRPFSSSS